jgi:hypothetical protein
MRQCKAPRKVLAYKLDAWLVSISQCLHKRTVLSARSATIAIIPTWNIQSPVLQESTVTQSKGQLEQTAMQVLSTTSHTFSTLHNAKNALLVNTVRRLDVVMYREIALLVPTV